MSMMPDDNFLWSRLDIQDEISLVQQLYDVYREGTESGTFVSINDPETEKYVRLSPDVCGVRNEKTFERFELNKVLFPISQKTYPYFDKAVGTNIYKASIDWKALKYYAGRLHDHEADQPYGQFKQNKYFKDALIKEAKERGGNEMVVTERILGKYLDHVSTAQKIRGENSPDHFIRFVETLRSLEKDGFLGIVETEFDFDAFPILAEEEMDKLEEGVSVDEDAYFYPAEHCQVTLRLMQLTSTSETLKRWGDTPLNKARNDLSQISDAGLERCFEDEIELINKLLQVCNPTTKSIQLIHPAHIANSSPDWAGFDKILTLKDLNESYGVLSNFDPPLDVFAKNPVGFVKANIDYQKLLQRAENLHDEVESWQGKVYGIEEQKRRIWERLQGRFRKNPQDEYEYSEWLLGPYTPRTESAPLGTSFSNPDPNRTDIRYQFMRAMRELEKDGRFEIVHVKIDFSAEPEPTETSLNAHKWSLGERSLEFTPAKHCKVTLRPKTTAPISKMPKFPLPEDTEWKPEENKYVLFFKDGRNLKFINLEKPTAKYFKLLIENHGQEVKHKKVRELMEDITKTQIENFVKALRKKVKNAKLTDRIKFTTCYEGGYTLSISPSK